MRKPLILAALILLLPGCRGTVPRRHGHPEMGMGISAVLIGGRIKLPTGETNWGKMHINLEGEGGREAVVYRLPVKPQQSFLYRVEPGLYRVAPTRSIFGRHQAAVKVSIEGRSYRAVYPRAMLRKAAVEVRPTKVVALGVLEAELVTPRLPGRKPVVRLRLDDSLTARRTLVAETIRGMMNPGTARNAREAAVAWTRALEETLSDLLAESERGPLFKPGPRPR